MVFTVALATTVINTLLSTSTPTPEKPKEEFHWCYTDSKCDENTWKDHFPICGGIRQSPINVVFAGTTAAAASTTASGNALTFGGYDQVRVGVFSNTVEHNTRGVRMTSRS